MEDKISWAGLQNLSVITVVNCFLAEKTGSLGKYLWLLSWYFQSYGDLSRPSGDLSRKYRDLLRTSGDLALNSFWNLSRYIKISQIISILRISKVCADISRHLEISRDVCRFIKTSADISRYLEMSPHILRYIKSTRDIEHHRISRRSRKFEISRTPNIS